MTGALCGIAAIVAFAALYSYAAANDPDYKFLDNYLSDLGVGPAAWAFNSALVISGSLMSAFALLGMHRLLGGTLVSKAGSATLAVAGALLVNVGVFTEDSGDTHFGFSIAFFFVLLAALGLLAYAMYRTRALGRMGTVGCAASFLFGVSLLPMGIGPLTETLAVLAALAWGTLTAALMLLKGTGTELL